MPSFSSSRRVGVSATIAYGVAADVGAYKEFLPLLQQSQVRGSKRIENGCEVFEAELAVAYEKLGLREAFLSHVNCDPENKTVIATASDGPFRSMKTKWSMKEVGNSCDVNITIDYAMRNPLIQFAVTGAMAMAVNKIMTAFELRAKALHVRAAQRQA